MRRAPLQVGATPQQPGLRCEAHAYVGARICRHDARRATFLQVQQWLCLEQVGCISWSI